MAPTWKDESFDLIDDEWDEETAEGATVGMHEDAAPLLRADGQDVQSTSPTPEVEVFFMTEEASVVEDHVYDLITAPLAEVLGHHGVQPHAQVVHAGVTLEETEVLIQAPLETNILLPSTVQQVYITTEALGDEVELSHTNYTDSPNDFVIALGNGCELCFVEHFNAYGIGRKVTLIVGREPLSAEAEDAFLSGQSEGQLPGELLVTTLPENFAVVSTLHRQLELLLSSASMAEVA